jgi:hypothetical protein
MKGTVPVKTQNCAGRAGTTILVDQLVINGFCFRNSTALVQFIESPLFVLDYVWLKGGKRTCVELSIWLKLK